MSDTLEQDEEISREAIATRASVIERFGATNDISTLLESVECALIKKQTFSNVAEGAKQPSRAQVVKRKEKIRGDIKTALELYKSGHKGMLIGDQTKGNTPSGSSIQEVLDQYVEALIKQDADPKKAIIPPDFLSQRLNAACDEMQKEIGIETAKILRDKAVEAAVAKEQAAASQRQASAVENARSAATAETLAARGIGARTGSRVDQIVNNTKQAVSGESMGRRAALFAALGLGTGAAALGTAFVLGKCNGNPTESALPTTDFKPAPIPVGFETIKNELSINGIPINNEVLSTTRTRNRLLFVGKNTHELVNKGERLLFENNSRSEIHVIDPTQHPESIVINTPSYATKSQGGYDSYTKEKDRPKVDLCFHPSVLTSYTLSANSVPNTNGKTTQDIVLSFDPKPGTKSDLVPFSIVVKGHGVDSGGIFTEGVMDQSGIDQIKLVDSRGQVIKAINAVKLSTARDFTDAINTLELEAGRSNDAPTPMSVGNLDQLAHYAAKRFQDLSQSHGEGKGTIQKPASRGR